MKLFHSVILPVLFALFVLLFSGAPISNISAATLNPAPTPSPRPLITRMSLSSSGEQTNGRSENSDLSEDGKFIAFDSAATNLVNNDTNGDIDVFVKNILTGIIERVSVTYQGGQSNDYSFQPTTSADGRFIAFTSTATNLVQDDTNQRPDVFVYDRTNQSIERVSIASSGAQANRDSYASEISADGRYITFTSHATNLVPDDTNNSTDIFVRDRVAHTTIRASVSADGLQANTDSDESYISPNGQFVTFVSHASNLVADDTNGVQDVFVRDLKARKTYLVSRSPSGQIGNKLSYPYGVSSNGVVIFASDATNLVPNDVNNDTDLFVKDSFSGTIQTVTRNFINGWPTGGFHEGSISENGVFVAFVSTSSLLVPNDTNRRADVFLFNRTDNSMQLVSHQSDAEPSNHSAQFSPSVTNSSNISFCSLASNLVPNDTNTVADVFLYRP